MKINFDNLKLKCECGLVMKKIRTKWRGGVVSGWRCEKCKEEIINPIDAQKALNIKRD